MMGKIYRVILVKLQVKREKIKDGEMDMINVSSTCDKVVVCKYMSIFFIFSTLIYILNWNKYTLNLC